MKRRIGFVGLGKMGKWMALNLLKGGHDLAVYDILPAAVHQLITAGAKQASSPAELARQVDLVFLSLPDTAIVEQVLFGDGGIAQGAAPGLLVVDCGTTSYRSTLEFARRLAERGVSFADAPVSGMESRAKSGTLTIMVGGEESLFADITPLLQSMGETLIYMGKVGNGQLAKLVNQILYNISAAAIAEVLPMAVKLGLEPEKVLQVVTTGTGRSHALEFFGPLALEGCFTEGYPLENAYKDMISAAEISAHERIPLPVTHAATTTYQLALADGLGRKSKGAMIKVYERILGVEFRKEKTASS